MGQKMDKGKRGRPKKVHASAPVEESLLIRQRLRNLCELAIAIGQEQGLLGNHDGRTEKLEGGQDVANQRIKRESDAT